MAFWTAMKLPIVKVAAGAVIVASVVGVGVMTGLIPGVGSNQDRPEAVAEESPPVAAIAAPSVEPAAPPAAKRSAPVKVVRQDAPPPAPAAAPVCSICGVVEAVESLEKKGKATGAGAILGGIAGLIVGNQVGDGKTKTAAKVIGAAGGAYAGNEIEKNARKTVQYRITVRMDDGVQRTFKQTDDTGLGVGDRVKVIDGVVVRG